MLPELPTREATVTAATSRPAHDAGDGRAAFVIDVDPGVATATLTMAGAAEWVAPNVLSLAHWDQILQGERYATSSRIDWRTLLKRRFDADLPDATARTSEASAAQAATEGGEEACDRRGR